MGKSYIKLDVYSVSTFSKNGTGGNKAGVVLPGVSLSENEKIQVARKMKYSETAFISKSTKADFKLEYFTPMGEVPLCGHATIGTFIVLKQLKLLKKSNYTIETKAGVMNITIDQDNLVFMEQNTPRFYELLNKIDIDNCFNPMAIDERFPIQVVSTGLKDILLPIDSPTTLENMVPNFSCITELSKEMNCIGIHAFSIINTTEVTAICRNFAPLYGIEEEAATGTSNCALACYLFRYGLKQSNYIFEQGYNLGNTSRIYVKIENKNDVITRASVGGNGYVIDKKSITID